MTTTSLTDHSIAPLGTAPGRTLGVAHDFARRAVLRRLHGLTTGSVELVERDTVTRVGKGPSHGSVTIHDPSTWTEIAWGGTVGAGAAYVAGMWSCDDPVAVVRLLVRDRAVMLALEGGAARVLGALRKAWHWSRRNTRAGSRANIAAHYDLGDEFFALWLDPSMTYSSAIFAAPDESLEQAQARKIDVLCRKLELSPTDHLLEIGTGWGALAIHAARTYGCRVTTATISRRQHDAACARVRAAGLESRVRVVLEDYRDLAGQYDKLVSVEMIEAVGHRYYGEFMGACARLLRPTGLAAIQAITIAERHYRAALTQVDFIQRYVFPGCCIPSHGALVDAMGRASDLDLVGIEDLTPHYALTLARWRATFHARLAEVRAQGLSEDFIRLWDFYLAYCEAGFRERAIGCAQLIMAKPEWRSASLGRPDVPVGRTCGVLGSRGDTERFA